MLPLVQPNDLPWAHPNRLKRWQARAVRPGGRFHFVRNSTQSELLHKLFPGKSPAYALAVLKRLVQKKAAKSGYFNRDIHKIRQKRRAESGYSPYCVFRLLPPSRGGSKLKLSNCVLLTQSKHSCLRQWAGSATIAEKISFIENRRTKHN